MVSGERHTTLPSEGRSTRVMTTHTTGIAQAARITRRRTVRDIVRSSCTRRHRGGRSRASRYSQGASPGRLGLTVSPLDRRVTRRCTQGTKWVRVHSAFAR